MAVIKSALEIALEKTEGVKPDKESVKAHELRQEGQRIASQALSDPEADPAKRLAAFSGTDAASVKEGYYQTLFANITLPLDETGLETLDKIHAALNMLAKDKRQLQHIHQQLRQFFTQYLEDRKRLEDALLKQFAGKLRQKEEQLSRQVGAPVKLNPASDPEFANAYKLNQGQLDSRYGQALEQFKQEISTILTGR